MKSDRVTLELEFTWLETKRSTLERLASDERRDERVRNGKLGEETSQLRYRRNIAQKSIVMIGRICLLVFASDNSKVHCYSSSAVIQQSSRVRTDFVPAAEAEGTNMSITIHGSYFIFTKLRRGASLTLNVPFAVNRNPGEFSLALTGIEATYEFFDYLPGALDSPHTHRTIDTEALYVSEGSLAEDLIDTATKSYYPTLQAGELWAFPILFHINDGSAKAEVKTWSASSNSNSGAQIISALVCSSTGSSTTKASQNHSMRRPPLPVSVHSSSRQ